MDIRSLTRQLRLSRAAIDLTISQLDAGQWDVPLRGREGPTFRSLLAHLMACRNQVLVHLAVRATNRWSDYLARSGTMPSVDEAPPELVARWRESSDALEAALPKGDLEASTDEAAPGGGATAGDWLIFYTWHEAYHVGQLASLRRVVGLNPLPEALVEAWGTDETVRRAALLSLEQGAASATLLQRRLSVTYAEADSILRRLHTLGVVGPQVGAGSRPVLVDRRELDRRLSGSIR